MRRFARTVAAAAFVASMAGVAGAATIQLSTNAMVTPGVFRVDMALMLPTADAQVLALQFDLDLEVLGKSLATSPGFVGPNATRQTYELSDPLDPDSFISINTPFDLSATVDDPTGAIDVRVVHAASDLFSVNSAIATNASLQPCSSGACNRNSAYLANGLIYLGSFNVNIPAGTLISEGGTGPAVQVLLPPGAIFGEDDLQPQDGIDDLIRDLRQWATDNGGRVTISGVAPEPGSLALMALALAALGFARRS
jgi:hypothetical protein